MKQQYRHTKPYRGKDPTFNYEEINEHSNTQMDGQRPSENHKLTRHENENIESPRLPNVEV